MTDNLRAAYERGMRFLNARREMLPDHQQQTAGWSDLAVLGSNAAAKKLRDRLAAPYNLDKRDYLSEIKFAAAVETIVENCGHDARDLLLDVNHPQKLKDIMQLGRTSDTRQRYRIDGVRDGRFPRVAPENEDPAFDTVEFKEIPSRLSRARGRFRLVPKFLKNGVTDVVHQELRRLAELICESALTLRAFIQRGSSETPAIPHHLQKDRVFPAIHNEVSGDVVGRVRLMLRFTIKSVWDFPEMQQRGIFPTENERRKTVLEINKIIAISEYILRS